MKKSALRLLILVFVSCIFYSCGYDELVPDFSNPNDPESEAYTPHHPYLDGTEYYGYTTLTSITLVWINDSEHESGFIIERSDSVKNKFVEIGRAVARSTRYKDINNFKPGIYYYYRVRAYKGNNISGPSNVVSKYISLY